jgi:excisionase family DNA binding protein
MGGRETVSMNVLTSRESSREYLSVSEVALRLGVSAPTIRRREADGSLRAVKLGESRNCAVQISRRALEEWLHGDDWAA